jgi:hypothetical protein
MRASFIVPNYDAAFGQVGACLPFSGIEVRYTRGGILDEKQFSK